MKDKLGDHFSKDDMCAKSRDDGLSLENYYLDVLEVSSGKFKAANGQKCQEATNFLLNTAGPLVGSMKIMLDLMKNKFEGKLAAIQADLTKIPQLLVDYLIRRLAKMPTMQSILSTS